MKQILNPVCNVVRGALGFSQNAVNGVVGLFCGPVSDQAPGPAARASVENDLIPGGVASGMTGANIIEMCMEKGFTTDEMERQIQKGIEVEMEHVIGMEDATLARSIAKEIALDHLKEFCNYYSALDAMEEKLRMNQSFPFII